MDLTQLANLGEFIGGVAVLVTLLYLAVQAREANRMGRLSAADKLHDSTFEICRIHMEDRGLYLTGAASSRNLEPNDKIRFRGFAGMVFAYLQNFHTKFKNGVVGQAEWDQQYQTLLWYLAAPGVREWWNDAGRVHGTAFGDLVTEIVDDIQDGRIEIPPGTTGAYLHASDD